MGFFKKLGRKKVKAEAPKVARDEYVFAGLDCAIKGNA